jgi:hypothetical protein
VRHWVQSPVQKKKSLRAIGICLHFLSGFWYPLSHCNLLILEEVGWLLLGLWWGKIS